MSVFVLVWTIELYVVQAITLVYPNETSAEFRLLGAEDSPGARPVVRADVDLSVAASLAVP